MQIIKKAEISQLNDKNSNENSDDNDLAVQPSRHHFIYEQNMNTFLAIIKSIVFLSVLLFLVHVKPRYLQDTEEARQSGGLTILLWNAEEHMTGWSYIQCGCRITNNRNYSNIDAVVINADQPYSLQGLDEIGHTPHFLVVFATKNPMSLVQNPLSEQKKSVFNFTMSYRLDSDLIWTDYYFANLRKEQQRVLEYAAEDKSFMQELSNQKALVLRLKLKFKPHFVVYMMYEVNSYSLPESLYLQELRKHMDLDAFDVCNGNECSHYMFMLIFDTSSCPDYVHPHFYMALSNFVVPVLIGGGNLSQLVPPGSYISGNDFESPQKLAEYLKMLRIQPQQYEQFFWWHSEYQLQEIRKPYCALCHQLRQSRRQRQPEEFVQWWTQYQCTNHTNLLAGALK